MKKILLINMVILMAISLTACGGEESKISASDSDQATASGELILDNGRGTANGHETEVPKR